MLKAGGFRPTEPRSGVEKATTEYADEPRKVQEREVRERAEKGLGWGVDDDPTRNAVLTVPSMKVEDRTGHAVYTVADLGSLT